MTSERRAYLDTSALAKWYLNEAKSDAFVDYLQTLDMGITCSLTVIEMLSLLNQRCCMGELTEELKSALFTAFREDINRGWLQCYLIEDSCLAAAAQLITDYPKHPLRTRDALHLTVAKHVEVVELATADTVIAKAATSMGIKVIRF